MYRYSQRGLISIKVIAPDKMTSINSVLEARALIRSRLGAPDVYLQVRNFVVMVELGVSFYGFKTRADT